MNKVLCSCIFLIFVFTSISVKANIDDYFIYDVTPSSSNYGNTGLMEIPNARFMSPASLRINFSASYPFEYTTLTATPFKWFEASYRYAEIKNKKYGPAAYSGNQTLKDKGFDVKIGLRDEKSFFPAVALGLRDIGGTGLLSSEYLVFSKKIVDDLIKALIHHIKIGNLNLKNVGTFKIIKKKERIGRNPKTKEEFIISSRKSISLTPSKEITEKLKKFI